MPNDVFRPVLVALSRFYVGGATVEESLQEVAALAVEALPGAAFAGISMWDDDRVSTRVFTDPESPAIDDAQYDTGRGPCLDAFREGQVFRLRSTEEDGRWPEFRAACREHGVGSTLSVPLLVSDDKVGALNFYGREVDAFDDDDAEVAVVFAQSAATVLANAAAYWRTYELSQGLEEALRSRAVIEQAKGILMAQSRVSDSEAFDLLRRASQRENRKLRDVAARLVARAASGEADEPGEASPPPPA